MPESIKIWGDPIAPPETITSRFAFAIVTPLGCSYSTPVARPLSITTRCTSARISTLKLGRSRLGWMYASAVPLRTPLLADI